MNISELVDDIKGLCQELLDPHERAEIIYDLKNIAEEFRRETISPYENKISDLLRTKYPKAHSTISKLMYSHPYDNSDIADLFRDLLDRSYQPSIFTKTKRNMLYSYKTFLHIINHNETG